MIFQGFLENVDPGLTPVLLKQTTTVGGQEVVSLGDREIEFNPNFSLYMVTSLPNPHYLPTVCIKVNLVNFMVTFDGLQDQLLSTVVQQVRSSFAFFSRLCTSVKRPTIKQIFFRKMT